MEIVLKGRPNQPFLPFLRYIAIVRHAAVSEAESQQREEQIHPDTCPDEGQHIGDDIATAKPQGHKATPEGGTMGAEPSHQQP